MDSNRLVVRRHYLFAVTLHEGGFAWESTSSGVKLTVQFDGRTDPGDVRKELEKHGIKADVQQYGREELNEFIVSSKLLERGESSEKSAETIKSSLDAAFPKIKILATETVGPAVGDFLKKSAVKLMPSPRSWACISRFASSLNIRRA